MKSCDRKSKSLTFISKITLSVVALLGTFFFQAIILLIYHAMIKSITGETPAPTLVTSVGFAILPFLLLVIWKGKTGSLMSSAGLGFALSVFLIGLSFLIDHFLFVNFFMGQVAYSAILTSRSITPLIIVAISCCYIWKRQKNI